MLRQMADTQETQYLEQLEAQRAAALLAAAEERAVRQELLALHQQGVAYMHPSYIKYGMLFALAIIIDLVDLVDLTGAGALIGRTISFFATAFMWAVLLLTNTKQKNARAYVDTATAQLNVIQQRIQLVSKATLGAAQGLRAIPGGSSLARAIPRSLVRVRRLMGRNPATRFLVSAVANLIPLLAVVPWVTVGIYLTYRAERDTYRAAAQEAEYIKLTLASVSP